MAKYPALFYVPVEVTLSALASSESTTVQIPEGGYRIIQYRVTGVTESGTATGAMLIPPEDIAGVTDDIVVFIKQKQSIINVTDAPISIWALHNLHLNNKWKGDWYESRTQVEFTLTDNSVPAALTLPITVRIELIGYVGDEMTTFAFANAQVFTQVTF